jgi:hypothetical protein
MRPIQLAFLSHNEYVMNCKLDVCYAHVELHRLYTVAQKPVNQFSKMYAKVHCKFLYYILEKG